MRILHMILSMTGGGAERQLTYIAPELSARGHDVHVAFVVPGVNQDRLAKRDCTLHHLAASRKFKPLVFAQSISLVRRLRPDVLQTWLPHMDIVGGVTARVLRVPWVISERCAGLLYPPTMLNRLRVAVARHAGLIVPNSEGGAEYWIGQGIDAGRLEIVPNYVPLAEIDAAAPLDDERVLVGDELVVHVGRLAPEKNLHSLIHAFEHVARLRPRARLAFCGDGPLLPDLMAQAEATGLRERFIFAGFVNNVTSWLKRASAVVAVSRSEGHPNAVLEAVVAGVPVIVSDIPAYRSILDEQSASFVAGDDEQAIAAAVVRTLEDRVTAEERAVYARRRLGLPSLEATASRYEEVYRRAIALAASGRGRDKAVRV